MSDKAGYQEFLRQHRNVSAPKPSWQERMFELFDYYGQLPPGTTMQRFVSSGFNYVSTGSARHDNLAQPQIKRQGRRPVQFGDLPLFQKAR